MVYNFLGHGCNPGVEYLFVLSANLRKSSRAPQPVTILKNELDGAQKKKRTRSQDERGDGKRIKNGSRVYEEFHLDFNRFSCMEGSSSMATKSYCFSGNPGFIRLVP